MIGSQGPKKEESKENNTASRTELVLGTVNTPVAHALIIFTFILNYGFSCSMLAWEEGQSQSLGTS